MANRHKVGKAGIKGGTTYPASGGDSGVVYQGGASKVVKEAKERKEGGSVVGRKAGGRLDRRARGGKVGSDKSPFSSAYTGD